MNCKISIYQEHLDMLNKQLREILAHCQFIKQDAETSKNDLTEILDLLYESSMCVASRIKQIEQKIKHLQGKA